MKKGSYSTEKVDKKERDTSPPSQEKDSHKTSGLDEKFTGDSEGNKLLPTDRSHKVGSGAASGEGANTSSGGHYKHEQNVKGPFLGDTKGNKDLPTDRTTGTGGGQGGRYIASSRRYHGGRSQSPEGN